MGAFLVTYPRDRIRAVLFIFVFARITFIPAALLIGFWFLSQLVRAGAVAQCRVAEWHTWRISAASSSERPRRDCLKIRVESHGNKARISFYGQPCWATSNGLVPRSAFSHCFLFQDAFYRTKGSLKRGGSPANGHFSNNGSLNARQAGLGDVASFSSLRGPLLLTRALCDGIATGRR